MVAGLDRYYQITRCFRDEDLRADRQPEFTQLDLEMSFVTQDEILELAEALMCAIFAGVKGVQLRRPFPRMTYSEAMARCAGMDCAMLSASASMHVLYWLLHLQHCLLYSTSICES